MKLWEPETRFRESLRNLPRALTVSTLTAGVVSTVILVSAPTVVLYQVGASAGLAAAQIESWLFAVMVGGGILGLLLSFAYRQPILGGVSLPAVVVLAPVLPDIAFGEAVGGYMMAGLIMVAVALSGVYERLLAAVPKEIVMGVLAGVLLRFGTGMFGEVVTHPWQGLPAVLAYLVALRWSRLRIPPIAAALVVGVVGVWLMGEAQVTAPAWALTRPQFYPPVFTAAAFFSISFPIALLLLSAQNATAIGVLWAFHYKAPVQAATLASGLFSVAQSFLGGHGANLGTPRMAVCAEPAVHRDPEMRYGAAVVGCLLSIVAGVFSGVMVDVFEFLPYSLMRVIAGLGLLPVFIQTLGRSVGSGRYRFGGLFALFIAASDTLLLGIGPVFWAMVLSPLISLVADPDWRRPRGEHREPGPPAD